MPGKKPGFGDAQQKAQRIEAPLAADQGHGGGDEAPADHDARDPDARAEFLHREIARHLEQDIAGEEDAGAGAEHRRAEAEILVHGERGEADIHPVEEIDRVAKAEKREQAAPGLGDGRFLASSWLMPISPQSLAPLPLPRNASISQWNGLPGQAWQLRNWPGRHTIRIGVSWPCKETDFDLLWEETQMAMTMAQASAAMREAMRETVKRYSTWYLLEGVLLVVAGLVALIYPTRFRTLVFLLGWILIVSGVLQGIGLIGAKDVPHFWLQLVSAVLALLIGILLLRNPNAGLLIMTVLLIVYLLRRGHLQGHLRDQYQAVRRLAVGAAQRHRRPSARRLSVGQHAAGSEWVLGVLLGIQLICRGRGLAFLAWMVALELTETMSTASPRETRRCRSSARRRSSGQPPIGRASPRHSANRPSRLPTWRDR